MARRVNAKHKIFDEFFAFDYPRLVGALTLMTGDRDLARDSVDEAVARAWEQVGRGRTIDNLAAWIRTVALNVVRGRFRRRTTERNAQGLVAIAPARDGDQESRTAALDVHRALATLPERQREVTVLFYFLDLPVGEIARELEVTEGTVKTSLHRARSALATVLGDEFADVAIDVDDTEVHVEV